MKRNIDHLSTREKLLELAAVLEKVQPERFNMRKWAHGPTAPTLEALIYAQPGDQACGTAACALGVATAAFEGLEWGSFCGTWYVKASESERMDYDAGAAFFGIQSAEARFLFDIGAPHENLREAVITRLQTVAKRY